MTIAVAPTVVSSKSYAAQAGVAGGDRAGSSDPVFGTAPGAITPAPAPQNIQSMQRVGSITVPPGANTQAPLGGRFDVWYDLPTHTVFIDITSQHIGGPA